MQESEKWKGSHSVVSNSSQPHGLQPTRLLCPWDFPGKSAGVGCHCLLWGKEISRLKKEIQTCFFLSVSCSYRFHSSNKCTWRQWLLISVTAVGSNFRIWFWFLFVFFQTTRFRHTRPPKLPAKPSPLIRNLCPDSKWFVIQSQNTQRQCGPVLQRSKSQASGSSAPKSFVLLVPRALGTEL